MRTRTGLVVVMFVAGAVGLSGSAAALGDLELSDTSEEEDDVYNTLPPGVTETLSVMGSSPCGFALQIMLGQNLTEVPEDRDEYGYEYDILDGECKDLRDALEHSIWNGHELEAYEVCRAAYGQNCIGLGHYTCDFYLIIGSGLVYICAGGITPYN